MVIGIIIEQSKNVRLTNCSFMDCDTGIEINDSDSPVIDGAHFLNVATAVKATRSNNLVASNCIQSSDGFSDGNGLENLFDQQQATSKPIIVFCGASGSSIHGLTVGILDDRTVEEKKQIKSCLQTTGLDSRVSYTGGLSYFLDRDFLLKPIARQIRFGFGRSTD